MKIKRPGSVALAMGIVLPMCMMTSSQQVNPGFDGVGFLKGFTMQSQALGVSKHGVLIVGSSDYHEPVPGFHHQGRPFGFSSPTGMTELPALPYNPHEQRGGQASGVSDNGAMIAGYSYFPTDVENDPGFSAVLWKQPFDSSSFTRLKTLPGYKYSRAVSISSVQPPVVVGYSMQTTSGSTSYRRGCYWKPPFPSTVVALDALIPNADQETIWPTRISANGMAIVGSVLVTSPPDSSLRRVPLAWTEQNGVFVAEQLPLLPGALEGLAMDVSRNGDIIVGSCTMPDGNWIPCKWVLQQNGDYQPSAIPNLPPGGVTGIAAALSEEGDVVVGYVSIVASNGDYIPTVWIWSTTNGTRTLNDALTAESVTSQATWSLLLPSDISPDGHIIVGTGQNPDSLEEGWVARLQSP